MIYLKSSPYPRFISTDDDERLSGYFLLIHKVGRKTRNNFHFAINGNVSLHVEIQFSQPSMASSMFKGLVTWWRVSGPVCNTIFGRVFALSLRQYLDAFTTGQNVSRGRPWSLKPCLAPNWILILAGFQLFQSFFFNWNCHSPSKLWFERSKSLNAFAWRDLATKQNNFKKKITSRQTWWGRTPHRAPSPQPGKWFPLQKTSNISRLEV